MARIFVAVGMVLMLAGVLIHFKVPLGRLPGDIVVDKPGMKLFIPITTSILASVALSVIAWLLGKFK